MTCNRNDAKYSALGGDGTQHVSSLEQAEHGEANIMVGRQSSYDGGDIDIYQEGEFVIGTTGQTAHQNATIHGFASQYGTSTNADLNEIEILH